jgi:hypothetical protein
MTDNPTTNVETPVSSEAKTDGPANLDALLAEFDTPKAAKSETAPTGDTTLGVLGKLKPVIDFATTEMATREKAEIDKTIKSAVAYVKEDEAVKDVPDSVVRAMLNTAVGENDKYRLAWMNRNEHPKAWQAALSEARKEVTRELAPVAEKRVSSDVMAARAAISGSVSTKDDAPKGPSPFDKFRMSEREWEDHKQRTFAAARG